MAISPYFRFPIYAWLLPLLPAAQITASNMDRAAASDGLGTGLAFLGIYLCLMFLLRRVFRKPQLTDLILAIVYCAVVLPIMFFGPGNSKLIWAAVWTALLIVVFRWQEPRRLLPIPLTVGSVMLAGSFAWTVATSPVWSSRPALLQTTASAFDMVPPATSEPFEKPDIYYFIFDRYHRNDYLKKIYGFDNQPFLDELRKRGFFIADQAYSNYQRTAHSVVSSLNFDYLDRLDTADTKGKSDWYPIFNMFQDFRIGRVLKSFGYEVHFSGTWWEPTRRIAIADQNHNFFEMPEMPRVIYEYSLLVDAARFLGLRMADPLYWQCQRSRLMFEDIRNREPGAKPKFHFAHFLIPHPPFVTHESGRCMESAEALKRTRSQNYIGQMKYANEQILATVDQLLARPGPKPIIILQADEGPWPEKFAGDEVTALGRDVSSVNWLKATPEELREKMAIFSAIYAPRLPLSDLTARMSPVNTFRIILKYYFNVPIEPLPDRNKIYLDNGNLYTFKDVTEILYGP